MKKESDNHILIEPIYDNSPNAILLSADNNFVKYGAVLIKSIMNNSNYRSAYDFIIFHTNMEEHTIEIFNRMFARHENFSIRFINVSSITKQYNFYTERKTMLMTDETYFRLLAPDLFSPSYERVIYLDCDMVVQTDIAQLYDLDLDGYYLAASRDITGIATCSSPKNDRLKYRKEALALNEPDNYFIAGFLVMNLRKLKEDYSGFKLMQLAASRNWRQHDQDVLNYICNQGQAKILHAAWNVLQDYGSNKYLKDAIKKEWRESEKKPKIIHYGGPFKPFERDVIRQEYFWKVAAETEFFNSIV